MNNNDFKPDSEVAPMANMTNKMGKLRPGTSHGVSFTPAELIYKLFRRKDCPACMFKMKPNKKKHFDGTGSAGMSGRGPGQRFERYSYTQWYFCERCNHNYSISELVEINKERKKRK